MFCKAVASEVRTSASCDLGERRPGRLRQAVIGIDLSFIGLVIGFFIWADFYAKLLFPVSSQRTALAAVAASIELFEAERDDGVQEEHCLQESN